MISGRGGGAGGGGRAGKIRPPRRMVKSIAGGDPNDIESSWEVLKEAMVDVHRKNCSKLPFEQVYRASYKIVLYKKGDILYDRVLDHEKAHFRSHIIPEIEALVTPNLISIATDQAGVSVNERRRMGEEFLQKLLASWTNHNTSMKMIGDILMYLDRTYTFEANRPSIFTSCMGLFRDSILRSALGAHSNKTIFDILNSVVLDLINMERDGEVIDHYMIKSTVGMLENLYETDLEREGQKLYTTVFEPAFLVATNDYYSKESERLLREADAAVWLRHTRDRLAQESDRCETTILRETREKSLKIVEAQLISKYLKDFIALENTGLRGMLDSDRFEDLSILYTLVSRIDPKKETLKNTLGARIVDLGREIEKNVGKMDFSVAPTPAGADAGPDGADKAKAAPPLTLAAQQTAAAVRWVDDVLKLKDKYDLIWENCFAKDLVIQTNMTKSFSDFINLFPRSSEYVSLYIDDILRRGIRGKTEHEVEQVLEKATILIRYLQDKDMFEMYYQKHLAKRLLHSKSESHDAEKSMISRMKQELGNQFTSKFEGMFKDMQISADLSTEYRDHIRDAMDDNEKASELTINILTTTNWPPEVMGRSAQVTSSTECNYPPEIAKLQESFSAFYLTNRTGRKLNWVGTAGNADIKCVFPAIPGGKGPLSRERRYELNVSTFGMVILMLFNEIGDEALPFKEIQAKTNIPTSDLLRTLTSLSIAPKARVLLKEPFNKRIDAEDTFRFNTAFVSKTVRIKAPIVNATAKVEGDEERKSSEEKNYRARTHIVDAAIVRIMKQRKELKHSQLISEVVTMLASRFKPEVSLVKLRIEDLMTREYLERVEDADTPTYRYMA
ncbi:cullin-3 [Plectosphaerella plurivora]|uniref:Cullin-3 n=1 Tax=Plectosphaerella plurivora TaxID=936078 RepID=A0A9P8VIL4_9PEZI|nr:cullin-3 [Plectosphaerella plurivora]